MRLVLHIGLVSAFFVLVACDRGAYYSLKEVPSTSRVIIEREIFAELNNTLIVYSQKFNQDNGGITFVCPCYLGGLNETAVFLNISQEKFRVEFLPGARYNVEIDRW